MYWKSNLNTAYWLPLYWTIPLNTRKRHDEARLQASQEGGELVFRSRLTKWITLSFVIFYY